MLNGQTIRERRIRLDLTQEALARLVGIRAETLSRFERTRRPIPRDKQLALEKILDDRERE